MQGHTGDEKKQKNIEDVESNLSMCNIHVFHFHISIVFCRSSNAVIVLDSYNLTCGLSIETLFNA